MKLSGRLESLISNFISIIKVFGSVVASLSILIAIYLLASSITLPNHPEFKPSHEGSSFDASVLSGDEKKKTDSLATAYCNGNVTYNNDKASFIASKLSLNSAGDEKAISACIAHISDVYGVNDLNGWSEFYTAIPEKDKYNFFLLAAESLRQYQIAESDNKSKQRDLSFDMFKMYAAVIFFSLFVLFSLLLVLIRIENNTRE